MIGDLASMAFTIIVGRLTWDLIKHVYRFVRTVYFPRRTRHVVVTEFSLEIPPRNVPGPARLTLRGSHTQEEAQRMRTLAERLADGREVQMTYVD